MKKKKKPPKNNSPKLRKPLAFVESQQEKHNADLPQFAECPSRMATAISRNHRETIAHQIIVSDRCVVSAARPFPKKAVFLLVSELVLQEWLGCHENFVSAKEEAQTIVAVDAVDE